jgi:hypothetical protein
MAHACTRAAMGPGMFAESRSREIESLLQSMILHLRSPLGPGMWPGVSRELRAQLEREEQTVFPVRSPADPRGVASLRGDHARLRELMAELQAGYDLGVIRKDALFRLLDALRTHAVHEAEILG